MIHLLSNTDVVAVQAVMMVMVAESMAVRHTVGFFVHLQVFIIKVVLIGHVLVPTGAALRVAHSPVLRIHNSFLAALARHLGLE